MENDEKPRRVRRVETVQAPSDSDATKIRRTVVRRVTEAEVAHAVPPPDMRHTWLNNSYNHKVREGPAYTSDVPIYVSLDAYVGASALVEQSASLQLRRFISGEVQEDPSGEPRMTEMGGFLYGNHTTDGGVWITDVEWGPDIGGQGYYPFSDLRTIPHFAEAHDRQVRQGRARLGTVHTHPGHHCTPTPGADPQIFAPWKINLILAPYSTDLGLKGELAGEFFVQKEPWNFLKAAGFRIVNDGQQYKSNQLEHGWKLPRPPRDGVMRFILGP